MPQGNELYRLIAEKTGQVPNWNEGSSEMRISCPKQCKHHGDTDEKVYIKAYNDVDGHGHTAAPAGLWTCFKGKTDFCCRGGNLYQLIGEAKNKNPDFGGRDEDIIANRSNESKKIRGWVDPGETYPLHTLDSNHPAVWYWKKRGYNPELLSKEYGVEWCETSGGYYNTPEGRKSYDRDGWLSSRHHYIFPIIMNGKKTGWQARSLGDPKPLRWNILQEKTESQKEIGFWGELQKDEKVEQRHEEVVLANGDIKSKIKLYDGMGNELECPPKYFHFFEKETSLGCFDTARQFKTVVVTEGWTKAWRVGKCATVTFGKIITETQLRMLGSYWDRVILLLDGDGQNLYHGKKDPRTKIFKPGYADKLAEMTETHAVTLTGYNDPGDCPHSEIWRQITEKTGITEPSNNY
jgi:hypothetical protein